MSSQEEYLDRLLKNLGAGNMDLQEPVKAEETVKPNRVFVDDSFSEQEDVSEEIAEQLSERDVSELVELLNETEQNAPENETLDDMTLLMDEDNDLNISIDFMSEEDVEKALNAASMQPDEDDDVTEGSELFGMLDIDSSKDSNPIKDLLEKDEQNMAVDAGILELLQGTSQEEPDLFDKVSEAGEDDLTVTNEIAANRMNMAEKKALREAKAAQKRERRDAKRQERVARKEAKRDAKRKPVQAEESDSTLLPHVDVNTASYNDLSGAENLIGNDSVADIGALYGMATVDMDSLQEISPVDIGMTAGNVTMGMDTVTVADSGDISAIQGIELTDLGLTGIDFMNLQEVQMNDADATADALFRQLSEDGMLNDVFGMPGEVEIVQSSPENADTTEKKKNKNHSGKGKSFFARFVDMITEEEEEETESKGNENLSISDENKAILDELDAIPEKKKKKGKTPEELEEIKRKKEEKRKAKAEKKEKKQETMPIRQKPLSRKKVGAVAILGVSAVVIIVIISAVMIEYMSKREARQAYYDQDYEVCYQNLFGKELNESEQIMFHRSEMILKMRLWLREYEILAQEGSEMEALDSLIQSVHEYPALFEYSNMWNAGADVQAIYDELVNILNQKYHLTEKESEEIAQIKDDVEYTKAVKAITEGMTYNDWKSQGSNDNNVSQSKDDTVNDGELPMIPGEEDGGNTQFIDNM